MSNMTREEAIEHLEDMKKGLFLWDMTELIDLCISALSTGGEYIKKDEAISKILVEFVAREENGKVMCACHDVKQTCADILDSLPSYSFPDSAENKGEITALEAENKTLRIKLENAEDVLRGLKEDLADARAELRERW